jgi:ribosome maturation factor RimP
LRFPCERNYTEYVQLGSKDSVGASPLFCWSQGVLAVRRTGLAFGALMDLAKIREAAERVARSEGVEVFDVEWKVGKQRFLRVYLDRPPGPSNPENLGISTRDCERVSEQLSTLLDVEELVPGPSYILEISSPGMDRKLVKESDYDRFAGRLAKVWLNEPVEGKSFLEARLAGTDNGNVKLQMQDHELAVPYASIKKANLKVEL